MHGPNRIWIDENHTLRKRSDPYCLGEVFHRPRHARPDYRGGSARAAASRFGKVRAGARTHWHTHPLGQALHVVSGAGRVQSWGGPIQGIRAGDTVWFAPGEKHWHGAAPNTAMTHIAMQEAQDGSAVDWLEPVSDEQYGG